MLKIFTSSLFTFFHLRAHDAFEISGTKYYSFVCLKFYKLSDDSYKYYKLHGKITMLLTHLYLYKNSQKQQSKTHRTRASSPSYFTLTIITVTTLTVEALSARFFVTHCIILAVSLQRMPGPVGRSDARPPGTRTVAGSIIGSCNIFSLRLVMKSFLRPLCPYR